MATEFVRSKQRILVTIAALLFGPLFVCLPLVAGVLVLRFAQFGIGVPLFCLCCVASGFLAYHISPCFHWVEFDGDILRGRKLYTRQLIERRLADLKEIVPLGAVLRDAPVNIIIDGVTGTSNRGYSMRFNDGAELVLIRYDMTDVEGFVKTVCRKYLSLQHECQATDVADTLPSDEPL